MARIGLIKPGWFPLLLAAGALLIAGSACIFSVPNLIRVGPVESDSDPTPPTPGHNLERSLAVQSTQVASLATQVGRLKNEVHAQGTMLSYLATRGPALPPPSNHMQTPSPFYPISGTLEIEGGSCCVGGFAGETTTIEVAMSANSPFGQITAMRVHAGGNPLTTQEFDQIVWQPFTTSMSFDVPIFVNWTGFYVQAQYRDALSNLSPIYVDDISVEGMPAPETPLP